MSWTRRLGVLLAISIGLNLLLAGLWVGARWAPHHRVAVNRIGSGHGPQFPAPLARALDNRREDFAAQRRAMAEARRQARALLEKDPLDRPALEQALERLRRESEGTQEMVHRALVDAAADAPKNARRELGRALIPSHRGMRGGAGLKGPRPGPSED